MNLTCLSPKDITARLGRALLLIAWCVISSLPVITSGQSIDFGFTISPNWTGATVTGLAEDPSGNVLVIGQIGTDSADFDPGPGVAFLGPPAGTPMIGYVAKYDPTGNYIWARAFNSSSSGGVLPKSVKVDAAGAVYVAGQFADQLDADPGPGFHLMWDSGLDAAVECFMVKLNADGNFVWAFHHDGSLIGSGQSANDHQLLMGRLEGTVDIDPGPGTYLVTSLAGYTSDYLLEVDSSGAFVHAVQSQATATDHVSYYKAAISSTGSIVVGARLVGTCDIDPGPGTVMATSTGGMDLMVLKFDASFNLTAHAQLGSPVNDFWQNLELDSLGNLNIQFRSTGTVDVDPGPAVANTSQYAFVHWDSSLTLTSITPLPPVDADYQTGPDGNIMAYGILSGSTDMDPGPGVLLRDTTAHLWPSDYYDRVVWKARPDGSPIYAWVIGCDVVGGSYLLVRSDSSFVLAGGVAISVDIDPGIGTSILPATGPTSQPDVFICGLKQGSCPSYYVEIDSLASPGCTDPGYISVSVGGGTPPYTYSWSMSPSTTDSFLTPVPPGACGITVTDLSGCADSGTKIITGPTPYAGFDLDAHFIRGHLQPGTFTTLRPIGTNNGCIPTSGQLRLVLDTLMQYINSVPSATAVSGDTVIWDFSSMVDGDLLYPAVMVLTPPWAVPGDTAFFDVLITPIAGDSVPSNNYKPGYANIILAPYDPNNKQVYPPGECPEHFVLRGEVLNYNINFQNIGTAPAVNVVIRDTLDPDIDWTSLKILAHSHAMTTDFLEDSILVFTFDSIFLPDSLSAPLGSMGFVFFQAGHKATVPVGTQLKNHASIYFDSNPPIVTNQTWTTLVDIIPTCVWPTQVAASDRPDAPLLLVPNPATRQCQISSGSPLGEVVVMDPMGHIVHRQEAGMQLSLTLDVATLPNGLYKVKAGGRTASLVVMK
jgi:uncharacterized repeat protein (TIGR01451 family)